MTVKMSISFKTSSKTTNIKHNNRDLKKEDYLKDAHKHIIQDLSDNNIYIIKNNLKNAYKIFDIFVDEYNSKQTRNDRKISNYYNHVKKSKSLDLQREFIITIGKKEDYDNLDANAKSIVADFLKNYVHDFIKRNTCFYVYNAVIHLDEIGAPHAHINIIPLATGYKKGIAVQPSFRKALENQGFKVNGRKQLSEFRNHEIKILEQELKQINIERKRVGTTNIKNIQEYKEVMKKIDKEKENLAHFENLTEIRRSEAFQLENGINILERKKDILEDELSVLQEKLELKYTSLNRNTRILNSLKDELNNLDENIKIRRSEMFQLENGINILERKKDILEDELSTLQDELKTTQRKIDNYDNDISEIADDIQTVYDYFKSLKTDIDNYSNNISDINKDLEFIKHLGYHDIPDLMATHMFKNKENQFYKKESESYKSLFLSLKDIITNFSLLNALDKIKQISNLIKGFVLPKKEFKTKEELRGKYIAARDNFVYKGKSSIQRMLEEKNKLKQLNSNVSYKIDEIQNDFNNDFKPKL